MILSHYPTDPTLHVFVLSSSTTLFIKRKKQQRRRRRQLTKTFINNTITALWQMLRVMLTWIAQCALWLVTKKKGARHTQPIMKRYKTNPTSNWFQKFCRTSPSESHDFLKFHCLTLLFVCLSFCFRDIFVGLNFAHIKIRLLHLRGFNNSFHQRLPMV